MSHSLNTLFRKEINVIENLISNNDIENIFIKLKIIDDYSPHSSIVDYTFLKKPKN